MRNYISKGDIIRTIDGYLEVTGYNGSMVSTDVYEYDEEGNVINTGFQGLTLYEIEQIMKEVDSKIHKVVWEDRKGMSINLNNGIGMGYDIDDFTIPAVRDEINEKWNSIVEVMDDEIREKVHREIDTDDNIEFLTEYLRRAEEDLIVG